jgi:chromosome segregation ATPase
MKRTLFVSLCTLILAVSAFAQDKAAQIADVKNQISTLENETPGMLKKLDVLKADKENIAFVSSAYDKQEAKYEQDVAAFTTKAQNLGRQYELLKPALDNYNQRVAAHNANQCVEKNHDGSCAWYTAEKNQLDNNQAQLQQAYAPLDAQKAQLQTEQSYLNQTHEKLETIRTQLNSDIDSWKGKIESLKSDWDAHEAKMAQLEAKLAALYGDNQSCMAEVQRTPECDKPNAVGPDGKPLLNGKCEEMVARCRRMFDGSK